MNDLKRVYHDDLIYTVNEDLKTAKVIDFDSNSAFDDIIIPRSIIYESQEYLVTSISKDAFRFCNQLKSIQFPFDSELQKIEKRAFNESTLESIFIPSKLTELEDGWCKNARKLTKIKVSPENKNFITYNDQFILSKSSSEKENFDVLVFCICDVESVEIPNFIEVIGPYSFAQCEELQKIKISKNSSLRSIKKKAFSNTLIERIYFPSKLKELEEGWCSQTSLIGIRVSPENPYFKSLNDEILVGKSSSDKKEFNVLLFYVRNAKFAFIPNEIEIIGPYSFDSCHFEKIKFLNDSKLEIIDKYAFYNCCLFEKIKIPDSVRIIGEHSFAECHHLKKIIISPNSCLQKIQKYAFFHVLFGSIFIPSQVEIIEERAFFPNQKLSEVVFAPDSKLKKIGRQAFHSSLLKTIKIPSSVEILDESAFDFCHSLFKMEIQEDSKLKIIRKNAFFHSSIKRIYIPSELEELENGWCCDIENVIKIEVNPNNKKYFVFENQFLLTKSSKEKDEFDTLVFAVRNIETAIIPNFIEIIGPYAFQNCSLLSKIEFEKDSKLRIICKGAFDGVEINKISIPHSLIQICSYAFCHCQNLQSIDIPQNSKLQIIEENAFSYSGIKKIFLPNHIKSIDTCLFDCCDLLKKVEFSEDSQITIVPYGLFSTCSSIVSFSLPAHFIKIGEHSFYKCTKFKLIYIPENSELQTIDECAFEDSSIESIFIPSKLVELKEEWCKNTQKLSKIEISPNNQHFISYKNQFILGKSSPEKENFNVLVFSIRSIKNVIIPNFIEIIEPYAFQYCSKIQTIDILKDSKLQIIKKYAFSNSSINKIIIPPSVKIIDEGAFYICDNLQIIAFEPNSELEIIGAKAFYGSLTSFSIPFKVTKIYKSQFSDCGMLQIIEIDENSKLQNIKETMFRNKQILMIPAKLRNRFFDE